MSKDKAIVVRNAKRAVGNISVLARNTKDSEEPKNKHEAFFVDLSTTGGRLSAKRSLGTIGEKLYLTFNLEVAGNRDMLGVVAEVRSCKPNSEENGVVFHHGLLFRSLSRIQQLLLHSWVLEHLLKRTG